MQKIFFLVLILFSSSSWAVSDLCDIIDLDSCTGVSKQQRRSSSSSLPSPASSANLNPANVSYDRGIGVEAVYQPHNPVSFNLASGTGKLGGALISQSLENSFFGNRVVELKEVNLERFKERKQYESKKLSLALGGKLLRKKHLTLDVGVLLKRHSEIKRVNPGIGFSGRLGPLHLGASAYQDDLRIEFKDTVEVETGIPYAITNNSEDYTEKFTVYTYSVGTRFKNLSVDMGVIKTKYDFFDGKDSQVHLYSSSYIYKKTLFNFAIRNEITPALKIVGGELIEQHSQNEIFAGIQHSLSKHFIVGVNYNFYLLREISINGTVFF
jgi:hypothetical protein